MPCDITSPSKKSKNIFFYIRGVLFSKDIALTEVHSSGALFIHYEQGYMDYCTPTFPDSCASHVTSRYAKGKSETKFWCFLFSDFKFNH